MNNPTLERIIATMNEKIETLNQKQEDIAELRAEVEAFIRVVNYYKQHPQELEVHFATPSEAKDAAEFILEAEFKPLHYKDELYSMLKQVNVEIAGSDPARNFGAYLSGDDRFESYGAGFWGLKKWEKITIKEPNEINGDSEGPDNLYEISSAR